MWHKVQCSHLLARRSPPYFKFSVALSFFNSFCQVQVQVEVSVSCQVLALSQLSVSSLSAFLSPPSGLFQDSFSSLSARSQLVLSSFSALSQLSLSSLSVLSQFSLNSLPALSLSTLSALSLAPIGALRIFSRTVGA